MTENIEKVLDTLNEAFRNDPDAMHALVCNRVPCNRDLADHMHIVVDNVRVLGGKPAVGVLGIVNGILTTLGENRIAASFEDGPTGPLFAGFVEYDPPGKKG